MDIKELETFTQECLLNKYPETVKVAVSLKIGEIRRIFSQTKISLNEARISMLKLISLSIFGAKIDFGFDQIMFLLESKSIMDIRTGYLGASLLLPNNSPHIPKLIPIVKAHLSDFKCYITQSLALSFITTIFDKECLSELILDIVKITTCCTANSSTRTKSLLVLSNIPRSLIKSDISCLISLILEGVLHSPEESLRLASVIYLQSIITLNLNQKNLQYYFDFALNTLIDIYINEKVQVQYYFKTPAPFYTMQLLKILELKYNWTKEEEAQLESFALKIFQRSGETLMIREAYSYLIVFSQLMHLLARVTLTESTFDKCIYTLSRHLKTDRNNILIFALTSFLQLISTKPELTVKLIPFKADLFTCLENQDINIAKHTAMILEKIAESSPEQCKDIILEMFNYLLSSTNSIRKILCNHIAFMAKSNKNEPKFFIDVMIQLLRTAGDMCSDHIWEITVSAMDKAPHLRSTYIQTLIDYIIVTPDPPEALFKLAVYIFGEEQTNNSTNIVELFASRFKTVSRSVQTMILSSLAKVFSRLKLNPVVLSSLSKFFNGVYTTSPYPEVSQRAFEYLFILTNTNNARFLLQSKSSFEKSHGKLDISKLTEMIEANAESNMDMDDLAYMEEETEDEIQEENKVKVENEESTIDNKSHIKNTIVNEKKVDNDDDEETVTTEEYSNF